MSDRNLNPHAEARVAMALWSDRYSKQKLGCMDFYDGLTAAQKQTCAQIVDGIIYADRADGRTPSPTHIAMGGKFALGDRVRKTKGSSWQGRIVGFYSTELTPIGYAVESEREPGSVQIYPETALAALSSPMGEEKGQPCLHCKGLGAFPDTGMDCAECHGGGEVETDD